MTKIREEGQKTVIGRQGNGRSFDVSLSPYKSAGECLCYDGMMQNTRHRYRVNSDSSDDLNDTSAQSGVFITFEGGEGVGKSTHILLLAARLEAAGVEVLLLREPGGTRIGESIRDILLDPAHAELDDMSELLLYEAARAQLVTQIIKPALARKMVVLCDRFTDSTVAYQGVARGLGFEVVERANHLGSKGLVPDRTIVLIHDPLEALNRATEEGADRLESEGLAFHTRVLEGYRRLAATDPARVRLVQSREHKEDTAEAIFAELADLLPQVRDVTFAVTDELIDRVRREHD